IHGGDSLRPVYRDIATINSVPSMGSFQTDRPKAALDTLRFGSVLDKKIPETWRLVVRNVLPRISLRLGGCFRRVQRRVVLFGMIAGKDTPINLFAVVVRMI